jgi:hypothetical protein
MNLGRRRLSAYEQSRLPNQVRHLSEGEIAEIEKSQGPDSRRTVVEVGASQRLRLRFAGKGGTPWDVACCEPRLARLVRRLNIPVGDAEV